MKPTDKMSDNLATGEGLNITFDPKRDRTTISNVDERSHAGYTAVIQPSASQPDKWFGVIFRENISSWVKVEQIYENFEQEVIQYFLNKYFEYEGEPEKI